MTTPTDWGRGCSPKRSCTLHNVHCAYPNCATGRREGIHAVKEAMTTPTPRTDALLSRALGEADSCAFPKECKNFVRLKELAEKELAAAQEDMKTAREVVLEHIIEQLLVVGRALCRVSVVHASDLKPYQIGIIIEQFNQIELVARAKLLAPNDTTPV